jgi:hypothetical protein
MMVAPVQSDAAWRRLFDLAFQIQEIAPWEMLEETEVFGVQHPETGVTDYVSIMGALGTHLAVGVYLGDEGWHGFWRIQKDAPGPETRPEEILEVPHLQLAFVDRQHMTEPDRALAKRLGIKVRRGQLWPTLNSYSPGLYPWPLDAAERERILPCLEQTVAFVEELSDLMDGRFTGPDELCPVRVLDKVQNAWVEEWRAIPAAPDRKWSAPVPADLLKSILELPPLGCEFEADVFMTMQACRDGEARPYWPYALLVMESKSGIMLKPELLVPVPSFDNMWADVPAAFLRILLESKARPAGLKVCSQRTKDLLEPVAKGLGIKISLRKRLPNIESARRDLNRLR